MTEHKSRDEIM